MTVAGLEQVVGREPRRTMTATVVGGPDAPQLRRVELAVSGMTCAACAARVENRLNKVDGVRASVNYATRVATVDAPEPLADDDLCEVVRRAGVLERCCGGLWFGEQLAGQQALCEQVSAVPSGGSWSGVAAEWLVPLRLRCSAAVLAALRRDLDRFWPAAVRLAAALPGDSWGRPQQGSAGLTASADSDLPYPVEVDLPLWVVSGDDELRRWLFSYGAAIRIEAPAELAAEHRRWLRAALAVYRPFTPAGGLCRPLRRRIRKRFLATPAAAARRARHQQGAVD